MMATAELSQFRFLGHRIDSLRFERQDGAATDGEYSLDIRFESHVESAPIPEDGAEPEQSDAPLSASVESMVALRIWLNWTPSPGPFEFELKVVGRFERHPDMPPEDFQNFSRVSGPSVLFAHIRPFVRTLMIEAGEQFRLPLLNVQESIRKLDRELESP